MPLAVIGGLMMAGAVLGGATSATISATKGINDACGELDKANQTYNDTKEGWRKALGNLGKAQSELNDLNIKLQNEYYNYKIALNTQMDLFRQRQQYINIFIGVFIFVIVLVLLLKYFKIFNKIWDLFIK